jgi:hypothetical protein
MLFGATDKFKTDHLPKENQRCSALVEALTNNVHPVILDGREEMFPDFRNTD